jgi:hypothetical protein
MLRPERRRPVRGDPAEVPPRLVPVTQLVGDRPELGRDPQHDRVIIVEAKLGTLQCLLQHPACRGQLTELAVHHGESPHRLDDVWIVWTEPDRGYVSHRLQ